MKKMYILVFTFIFLVCLATACAETNNIGTPQDVYNEICRIFGEPYNKSAKRSTLADMFGDGIMEDLIFVLDRGKEAKEFWIALNRPDKPREMSLWIIDPATQNDYKKLFTILHHYAVGYGISETNRCIFFSYTDKEFYAFDTSSDLITQNEFNQIDKMIEYLIKKYHSELLDWYESSAELFVLVDNEVTEPSPSPTSVPSSTPKPTTTLKATPKSTATPKPTAKPTATPKPITRIRINEGSNPNVRSKPSTDGQILGNAKSGQIFELLATSGTWYKIRLANGTEGWIANGMATVIGTSASSTQSNKTTPKPTAKPTNKPTSKPNSGYMSDSELIEMAKGYFYLHGGSSNGITGVTIEHDGDISYVGIAYNFHLYIVKLNRKTGLGLNMTKVF